MSVGEVLFWLFIGLPVLGALVVGGLGLLAAMFSGAADLARWAAKDGDDE